MDTGRSSRAQQMNNLVEFLQAQGMLGVQVLGLIGTGVSSFMRSALGQMVGPKTSSCCDIPEPCWLPKLLDERDCRICPGASGSVRIIITNEDVQARTTYAMASGPAAAHVTFTPGALSLGPKERGTITAVFAVPPGTDLDDQLEALVWLRGCRDYYLRWTVISSARPQPCCEEIALRDGPDHVLHWYDHFYCARQCHGGGKTR